MRYGAVKRSVPYDVYRAFAGSVPSSCFPFRKPRPTTYAGFGYDTKSPGRSQMKGLSRKTAVYKIAVLFTCFEYGAARAPALDGKWKVSLILYRVTLSIPSPQNHEEIKTLFYFTFSLFSTSENDKQIIFFSTFDTHTQQESRKKLSQNETIVFIVGLFRMILVAEVIVIV